MLLLGGTVVFAVERLARKGRRNASGKRGDWEEDWMKVRRIIGASIFFWAVILLLCSSFSSPAASSSYMGSLDFDASSTNFLYHKLPIKRIPYGSKVNWSGKFG